MKSNIRKKMKNKDAYLILLILILYFSLVLQGNNNLFNEQDDEGFRNFTLNSSDSNSVTSQWNRLWGGIESDIGQGVAVDSSGNVYLAGSTRSYGAGSQDMVLVKYDSFGVQQWNRTWGGNSRDEGYGVAVDTSENVYLVGVTFMEGSLDIGLVKYDSSGVQQWNRTWGGSNLEFGQGVAVDSSENVYVVGRTLESGGGLIVVKYDSSGVQQWNHTLWGNSGYGVAVDSLDNIYLAGNRILVKYDSSGVQQWNRTWGGYEIEYVNGVTVDSLDNIYLAGMKITDTPEEGYSDMILVKYNSSGIQLWNRTWGGSSYDSGYGVAVDSSENVYLAGHTHSFGSNMVLVKYNGSGVQQWNRTWGGSNLEWCFGVVVGSSGNIYLAGSTQSYGAGDWDIVLVKYITSIFTLNSPNPYDWCGIAPLNFNISLFESNLDTAWYSLDGGITNITCSGLTGTINQTEWDKKGSGMVIIRFYANNTMGEEWYVEVSIFKDNEAPFSTINSPIPNQLCGVTAPNFNVQIIEANLQQKMYSLNGRPNITFTTHTQFNQIEWNQIGNGTVLIKFYAIDKGGNINSSEVIVRKDAYAPVITILSPLDDEQFGKIAPNFNISITEEDLDSIWYIIEGIAGTFPLSDLTGTIDQDTWDDLPKGEITITYYAQDKAGNVNSESVTVLKSIPSEPRIPSYNIFFLLGILSFVAIILTKKLKKS